MASKLFKIDDGKKPLLAFFCPGCESNHAFDSRWQFSGDFEKPTFKPSLLVRGTKITEKGWQEVDEWKAAGKPDRNGQPFDSVATVCHSFVTDGRIQYLNDCTHALTGQTVDMPDWED